MSSDDLEFSICQYLDGSLAGPDRAALETRLSEDAEARAMLQEQRELTAAIKASPAVAGVRWDALAERINDAVADEFERDQFERSVCDYIDGDLSADEAGRVEARVAADADAMSLLAEHRGLTAALKRAPLPDVKWDLLAERITRAVDDDLEHTIVRHMDGDLDEAEAIEFAAQLAKEPAARELLSGHERLSAALRRMPPVPVVKWDKLAARISASVARAEGPVTSYRIGPARPLRWAAMAASLMLAAGLGIRLLNDGGAKDATPVGRPEPMVIAVTDAPADDPALGGDPTAVAAAADQPLAIEVGPSPRLASGPRFARLHDTIVSRPSQVIIARSSRGAQDVPGAPY